MRDVYLADEPARAHLVKGYLETNGIPAEVVGDQPFWADGSMVPKDMRPTVRVSDENGERAIELLRAWEEQRDTGGAWTCASCGGERSAQFTDCWRCGTARDADGA